MPKIAIDTRATGWVNSFLTRSITDAIATVGREIGLDALEWTIRIENGEIFVLGTPSQPSIEAVGLCRRWAAALCLDAGRYDEGEDVSSWSRADGPWLIEVATVADGD